MRAMIILPGRTIYHEQSCWHLRRSQQKNWIRMSPKQAEGCGFRACKCCGTTRFHLTSETKTLNRFIQGKHMEYKLLGNTVYVKTEISCWSIRYLPRKFIYSIYHRNASPEPVNFAHPELERYHCQADKRDAHTLEACFQYIHSHDAYRKSELECGGDIRRMNISPKYRQQLMRKERRRQHRRINALFAALEREHPKYAALACC